MKKNFINPKLIRNFQKLRDAELAVKGENVLLKMTGNPSFPAPAPTLEEVSQAIGEYSEALAKVASRGTTEDVIIKDQKRELLEEKLSALADYVETTADDNAAVLASSGFDLAKTRTPVGILPKPEGLNVAPGANKGSMEITWKPVPRSSFYEVQFSELPQTNGNGWQTRTSKKSRVIISELISGKEYIFRTAAAGSDEERVWSETITSFVL
jgi:fibronectin type III domain protein